MLVYIVHSTYGANESPVLVHDLVGLYRVEKGTTTKLRWRLLGPWRLGGLGLECWQ